MKTKLFTFLLAMMASMGTLFASDISVDGIWYDFDSSTQTATVTFQGDFYDSSEEYEGFVVLPSSVTYNGITYSVTTIGMNAFNGCSSLNSVTIPNSVTSIGNYAFNNCFDLYFIECEAVIPPTLGDDVFYDFDEHLTIYVPAEGLAAYQAADQWNYFVNIIPVGLENDGSSCLESIDIDLENGNTHQAEDTRWYVLRYSYENVPDTSNIRIHFTNLSTNQNNNIEIGVYFDCFDPSFLNKNYQQIPEEDYYIDIDRDLMNTLVWPYIFISCTSEKTINIWSELIPDMPLEFVHDTIIDYICEGDTYWDPITNATISPIEHSLTYNDTISFYDGLLIKDSIIVHQIRPVVVPEPLSLEAMQAIGAAPQLIQGMQLSVTESSALLTDYYRYLSYTVDTIAYIDTVYWAKPVYKSDGSLDVTQEASLDLSKWYSTNDHFDTLLLVVRSEDCYVVQRIPYIFPITASSCISASGTCGENLTWELTGDSVLTISGTGAMWRLTEEQAWRPYKEQIKTAILPEGLDSIAPKAFYQCVNLTSVNLPNSVRALGTKAFVECYKLAEPVYNERIFAFLPKDYSSTYSVPEGIVSVAAYAISYLLPTAESNAIPSSLKEIVLPSSLKRLGISSLAGAQLEKITCYATTPPVCAQSVFDYYYDEVGIVLHSIDRSIPVYVPAESVEAYKAANQWSSFFNILPIEEPIETVEADYNVVYTGHDDNELSSEFITLHVPVAPEIEGFTFLKWQVVAGDLEDGIVIEAVYTADAPLSAPAVYTDPANPAQKLIRDGNVYILKGNKTYTITGQEEK